MRNISKRKLLLSTTIVLLFLCLGSWWFGQLLPSTSIYPNTTLIDGSNKYSEFGLIKSSQFQIFTFSVNDSYQEVLRWFLNNDWNISFASHERLYQFTREETISDSYPQIRLVYFVNIQPSGTNQTCISQGTYASVILFDGEVIYRSPDYKDASLEYFYNAPDCPTNADTVP